MIIKTIRDEDYSSYREVAMMVAFPNCSFKCCTDIHRSVAMCQNSPLARLPNTVVSPEMIFERYKRNVITHAIVCGGLEPMDSYSDLLTLIGTFRHNGCDDPFIIYTGYTEYEIEPHVHHLALYPNIIMKFGRYVPQQPSHFDTLLGVTLASPNQYSKRIS